ncbi:hypothetical protein EYF80_047244 [Liparis tanakae]|uniref:Uncharacterized protein n=1 Tax=Liparis tanakae TaxID=230148 RepID=A0A4Z2FNV7_9TELE|nr:hypothetical protein EYF80_047244 [Liparis tanakae]
MKWRDMERDMAESSHKLLHGGMRIRDWFSDKLGKRKRESHISEEQPARDQGLLGGTGGLAHDVQIGGVEAQSGGGQTVSDQVDPQQLDGDESLGQTQGSDSSALLDSSHDGGEVVVSEDHLRGRLGNSSARAHGDTDLGLLQGGGIVHSISGLE